MTNLKQFNYYLVLDLEATCCDKGSIAKNHMEIIEIGAVMVEPATLTIVDEFQSFVKPIRHPILTEFCKSLTSIAQTLFRDRSHLPRSQYPAEKLAVSLLKWCIWFLG